MPLKPFRKWVRLIYLTRDDELDCDQLFENIPQYIDLELSGEDVAQHLPAVKHHLEQCAECYDMYVTLRDVALLESQPVASQLTDVQH